MLPADFAVLAADCLDAARADGVNCEACADAEKHPHLYQLDCLSCMARAIRSAPDTLRPEVLRRFEIELPEDDRARLREMVG